MGGSDTGAIRTGVDRGLVCVDTQASLGSAGTPSHIGFPPMSTLVGAKGDGKPLHLNPGFAFLWLPRFALCGLFEYKFLA